MLRSFPSRYYIIIKTICQSKYLISCEKSKKLLIFLFGCDNILTPLLCGTFENMCFRTEILNSADGAEA